MIRCLGCHVPREAITDVEKLPVFDIWADFAQDFEARSMNAVVPMTKLLASGGAPEAACLA